MVNKNNVIEPSSPEEAGQESKTTITAEKSGEYVENPKILALISSLTALMLQVKQLADGET